MTITINMDKKCVECGKGGAADSGICLGCTTKALQGKPMKSPTGRAVAQRFLDMKRR
jgi:hypothetical protein